MIWKIALLVITAAFGIAGCKSTELVPVQPQTSGLYSRQEYVFDRFGNTLTVYRPKSATGPVPWLFEVPGGGWKVVSRPGPEPAAGYGAKGIAIVHASYRTANEARWPAQLDDVEAAFAFTRGHATELGLRPNRYAITGNSAGSTEAAWLSIREAPSCTVLNASPLDFTTFRNRDIRKVLGGYDPKRASPVFAVHGGMAPTVLIHGTRDKVVPFSQSEEYDRALRSAGVDVELWRHEGGHLDTPPSLQQKARDFIAGCLGVS